MAENIKIEDWLSDSGKRLIKALELLKQFKPVEMEGENTVIKVEGRLFHQDDTKEIIVYQDGSPWFSPLGELVFKELVELADDFAMIPVTPNELEDTSFLDGYSTEMRFAFYDIRLSTEGSKRTKEEGKVKKLYELLEEFTIK